MKENPCDGCYFPHKLHIIEHNRSRARWKLCSDCAERLIGSAPSEYTYHGAEKAGGYSDMATYSEASLRNEYLAGLRDEDNMYVTPGEMPWYGERTAQEIRTHTITENKLESLYNMPSDAVLDEYIDKHPDRFSYVAYTDNEEDKVLSGLNTWAEMRSTAMGG